MLIVAYLCGYKVISWVQDDSVFIITQDDHLIVYIPVSRNNC